MAKMMLYDDDDYVENVEDAEMALMIFIWTVMIFPEGVGLPVQALQGADKVGLGVCHHFHHLQCQDHIHQHPWSPLSWCRWTGMRWGKPRRSKQKLSKGLSPGAGGGDCPLDQVVIFTFGGDGDFWHQICAKSAKVSTLRLIIAVARVRTNCWH